MTKQALKRLHDDERQNDVGREVIEKMLRGDDLFIDPTRLQQPASKQPSEHKDFENG